MAYDSAETHTDDGLSPEQMADMNTQLIDKLLNTGLDQSLVIDVMNHSPVVLDTDKNMEVLAGQLERLGAEPDEPAVTSMSGRQGLGSGINVYETFWTGPDQEQPVARVYLIVRGEESPNGEVLYLGASLRNPLDQDSSQD